jgi:polar amino acid transport system permease protein
MFDIIEQLPRFFTYYNILFLLQAMGATLALSVAGCIVGSLVGLALAILRRTRGPALMPLRAVAILIVEFFRRVPVLVVLMLVFFFFNVFKLNLTTFYIALIALCIIASAFMAEIFRAGLDSIHQNQWDAAEAMNLGFLKTIQWVVLPQAWKLMVPPAFSFFLLFIKDTAFASQIGVLELTYAGKVLNQKAFSASLVFGTILVLYFILSYPLARFGTWMEQRLASPRHTRPERGLPGQAGFGRNQPLPGEGRDRLPDRALRVGQEHDPEGVGGPLKAEVGGGGVGR